MRAQLYSFYLESLELPQEEGTGCQAKLLDYQGIGREHTGFWDHNCAPINTYPTSFSFYNSQDYKRCICQKESAGQDVDVICPFVESSEVPSDDSDEPEDEDENEDVDDENDD